MLNINSNTIKLKNTIIFIIILFSFLVFGEDSLAVPTISGVSGTFSDGQTISITGAGFGANGPNIFLFDDFEKGINGNPLMSGYNSAQLGKWDKSEGNPKGIYSNLYKVSGSNSARFSYHNIESYNKPQLVAYWPTEDRTNTDVFISYWMLIPENTLIPGEDHPDGTNWKVTWLWANNYSWNDVVLPTSLGTNAWLIVGNNFPFVNWFDMEFTKGQWKKVAIWIKGSTTTNGQLHFWELTSRGVIQRVNRNNIVTMNSVSIGDGVYVPGYGRAPSYAFPTYDDIYIAIGPNARARIEIGNAPNYYNSTNLAISTVINWSDNSITATFRQGSFVNAQQAYLYVVDSDGNVNTTGYPITIGGAVDTTPPSPPTGLRVE